MFLPARSFAGLNRRLRSGASASTGCVSDSTGSVCRFALRFRRETPLVETR